jgi:cap1 methyltransferase
MAILYALLQEGGTYVCKFYDMQTKATASLVRLLVATFAHVDVVKPITSRPANAERYTVCRGLLPLDIAQRQYIIQRLNTVVDLFARCDTAQDIVQLAEALSVVGDAALCNDDTFFRTLTQGNDQ